MNAHHPLISSLEVEKDDAKLLGWNPITSTVSTTLVPINDLVEDARIKDIQPSPTSIFILNDNFQLIEHLKGKNTKKWNEILGADVIYSFRVSSNGHHLFCVGHDKLFSVHRFNHEGKREIIAHELPLSNMEIRLSQICSVDVPPTVFLFRGDSCSFYLLQSSASSLLFRLSGHEPLDNEYKLQRVNILDPFCINDIQCGNFHAIITAKQGQDDYELYSFGWAGTNALGRGQEDAGNLLIPIDLPCDNHVQQVLCGLMTTFIVTADAIYACGKPFNGNEWTRISDNHGNCHALIGDKVLYHLGEI